MSLPHLRPLGFGEILDGAFTLYRRHFVTIAATALVPYVPMSLASGYFSYLMLGNPDPFATMGLFFLMMVVSLLAMPVLWAALTRAFSQAYVGGEVAVGDALSRAFRALGPLLAAGVLVMLGASALLVAVSVPLFLLAFILGMMSSDSVVAGVLIALVMAVLYLGAIAMLAATLYAVVPAIVVERLGPFAAISRSLALSRGAWGRAMGVFLVGWLVTMLPMLAVMAVTGTFQQMVDPTQVPTLTQFFFQQVFGMLIGALSTPFMVGAFALLYYDRRVRTEAYDLQVAAEGLPALA